MITKINNMIRRAATVCCGVAAAAAPLTSCSDFLEIEPLNEIVLDNFWNEKADVDGIIAGCYSGLQDDGLVRRIWNELGYKTKVVGTGGLVGTVAALSETIDAIAKDLTLEGLRIIYERTRA